MVRAPHVGGDSEPRRTLELLVQARAAVSDETVASSALAAAAGQGISAARLTTILGIDYAAKMRVARVAVDAAGSLRASPDLAADLARLAGLRPEIDAGRATFAVVQATFTQLSADVDLHWQAELADVRGLADKAGRGAGPVDEQVNVLRATFAAFQAGSTLTGLAYNVVTGQNTPANAKALVEANGGLAADEAAFADLLRPTAAAAWRALRNDPAGVRFATVIDQAIAVALRSTSVPFSANLNTYGPAFSDGATWVGALAVLTEAAATDLRDIASSQDAASTHALDLEIATAITITVLAVAAAASAARAVSGPVKRLATAAREIGEGRFSLPPLTRRGPRELADTALAVNEMTATLTALETYTVALAGDLRSPRLDQPLPGRTGEALQVTVDRLRATIDASEQHRGVLQEIATHDNLTGLLNRGAALDAIGRDLLRSQRDGTAMMALFIDLDGLKVINDTYGHDTGDEAIRLTADGLRAATRRSDIVARIGGDEFLVAGLAPDGAAEAEMLAERIRRAVGDRAVSPTKGIPLRCSVGIALAAPGDTVESLIGNADQALYRAKQHGRNQIAWHAPSLSAKP
jgi:diguanylate cyclase (GGDEF)-like protein